LSDDFRRAINTLIFIKIKSDIRMTIIFAHKTLTDRQQNIPDFFDNIANQNIPDKTSKKK